MVGDRYRKRAKSRKRDFEREKHDWSDEDSNSESENFVSQRKMRKASKEEGGKLGNQACENPKRYRNKKNKKLKKNTQNQETKGHSVSKSSRLSMMRLSNGSLLTCQIWGARLSSSTPLKMMENLISGTQR